MDATNRFASLAREFDEKASSLALARMNRQVEGFLSSRFSSTEEALSQIRFAVTSLASVGIVKPMLSEFLLYIVDRWESATIGQRWVALTSLDELAGIILPMIEEAEKASSFLPHPSVN